ISHRLLPLPVLELRHASRHRTAGAREHEEDAVWTGTHPNGGGHRQPECPLRAAAAALKFYDMGP
ncbi:MAG: hypothetical protein NC403_07835, partial [Muribaculaceae bacterium]|nr:hypothetical protein [Muribaculaceae bacterium]